MCRLCFYKINKCCCLAFCVVKTFPSLLFVQTITLSNYTHSISPHQPTDSITISLLSYTDASFWFLPTFGDPFSARQTRERRLSGSPLPPPPPLFLLFPLRRLNCPLTVNSSVNSLVLLPSETITGARASRSWWKGEGGGGERERSICCGGARGAAASGGPGREPIRERPWRPFVRAACGDEWKQRKQWESRACAQQQSGEGSHDYSMEMFKRPMSNSVGPLK